MQAALPRRWMLIVGTTLILALLASWSSTAPAATKQPSASSALKTLVLQTSAMPKSSISSLNRARLLASARRARAMSRPGARAPPSTASTRTASLLLGTTIKRSAWNVRRRARRCAAGSAKLGTQSITASRALLKSKRTSFSPAAVLRRAR